ncbi:MAG: histidinol-phosphate transaminase, partial [Bacteroidales bacterium]|nr:histidinol-phosphate transaminase [Bacteroidales bacterium]
ANENPYGTLNRYPDPYQRTLKKAISELKNIPEENIFLGNGSDEIIDLYFRVFCRHGIDRTLVFPPTYGMYEVSAAINDSAVIKLPLNKSFQIDMPNAIHLLDSENLKLIFICSPNNPTGNSMNRDDIETILAKSKSVVVIDEAYIDFSDKPSLARLIEKYPNLVVMQTFSKAMGLASVRVGIAFMSSEIIQYFNKVKPPYNISQINQKAALARIGATHSVEKEIAAIKNEKLKLTGELSKLSIIEEIYPSDTNFFLAKVKDADRIYSELIKHGIVVRNRNSVVKNCIRITVGKPSENSKLLKAIKTIEL